MTGAAQGIGYGCVFDVQRFSVHDGPGIRTTVFLKGCPLRCLWCQNPESFRSGPELAFYPGRCRRSGACEAVCRRGALQLDGARVLRDKCDACGDCVTACPNDALRVIGRSVTAEEIFAEIVRDLPFYRSSGGGVTISGGEPTLQMAFVVGLATRCRERGITVGLQTCGAFRWETLAPYLPLFDFVHFDLKVIDRERHREATGADNRLILENARRLVEAGASVVFRTPLIPRYTDDEVNLAAIAALLRELGVKRLHALRYHAMGESKLEAIGSPLAPLDLDAAERGPERFEQGLERLRGFGLEITS